MGIASVPAAAGGGIKSVQRGSAAGAGTVTITAVNISKSFVTVFGTASSGAVAISGSTTSVNANTNNQNRIASGYAIVGDSGGWGMNIPVLTLSGGTNNLVTAVVQGYLNSSTELVVSGACRYEVVEFA